MVGEGGGGGGGLGDSLMKGSGMVVIKFELTPKGEQTGRGSRFI